VKLIRPVLIDFTFMARFSNMVAKNPNRSKYYMVEEKRLLPERRLTAAERRAGRRYIAQLLEQFPRIARLAYPVRGEEAGIVYVRMPIPGDLANAIDEYAAVLTGIFYEQEQIRVLLISDEFATDDPISDELELKVAQAQMSCDIDSLRKLRKYKDSEAVAQREYYSRRYRLHMERILKYLGHGEL
jgi:hypothetical protein